MINNPPNGIHRRITDSFASWTALLVSALLPGMARSAALPTAADFPAAQALGVAQDDTVWLKATINNVVTRGSGTLIRGADADWVLTAAHCLENSQGLVSSENIIVGNGSSYFNDLGTTSSADYYLRSPNYSGTFSTGSDWAFVRLTNRISSPNLAFVIGASPSRGERILFTGFGLPRSFLEGTLPNNGNVASFYGSFVDASFNNYPYDNGDFTGESNSGVGTSRDSGGSVKAYSSTTGKWENIGTIVFADLGSANYTGFFDYHAADQPFRDFLTQTVRPVTAIPNPPSIAITISPSASQIFFSNLIVAREYRVMRSPSLNIWEEAHRFTAAAATGSWGESLATGGTMFYRLEWNE